MTEQQKSSTPMRLRGMPKAPNVGIFPPGTTPLPNGPDRNLPLDEAVKSTEESFGMKVRVGVLESDANFPGPVNSWHVHHYFDNRNADSIREALKLRWDVMNKFPNLTVNKPFRNAPELGGMQGPVSTGQWELELHTPNQLSEYIPWVVANHGNMNVLVHPNTQGQMIKDHTVDSFWLGKQEELTALQAKVAEVISKIAKQGMGAAGMMPATAPVPAPSPQQPIPDPMYTPQERAVRSRL